MNAKSLKQLCVKTICENIATKLSTFIIASPLPWKLTEKVIENYSTYKWEHIIKQGADGPKSRFSVSLGCIVSTEERTAHHRNSSLCANGIEIFPENNKYCMWMNYYRVDKYNLHLCYKCLKYFQVAMDFKNKSFLAIRDHFHYVIGAEEITYNDVFYWCQNCFERILFQLKDQDSCEWDLHHTSWGQVKRFNESSDSDSDFELNY